MPLWKLLKLSREMLSTWGGLADEERERVRGEATRIRGLVAELAHLAGPFAGGAAATGEAGRDIKQSPLSFSML
jgi:hypothetical protein